MTHSNGRAVLAGAISVLVSSTVVAGIWAHNTKMLAAVEVEVEVATANVRGDSLHRSAKTQRIKVLKGQVSDLRDSVLVSGRTIDRLMARISLCEARLRHEQRMTDYGMCRAQIESI